MTINIMIKKIILTLFIIILTASTVSSAIITYTFPDPMEEQWTYVKYAGIILLILGVLGRNESKFLEIIGVITILVSSVWGLALSVNIVASVFGKMFAFLSLLVFPAILIIAPPYAAFIENNYLPLTVIYGGIAVGLALFFNGYKKV